MSASPRESWVATTHSWAQDVNIAHLEHARRLVGAVGADELVHLVLEVLAYADDEAEDLKTIGTCSITLSERQISITDDGRGTDTRRDERGIVIRKPVMSTEDVRFFGRTDAPQLPDGVRRQGISVVAAACRLLIHENRRQEGAWTQEYEFGVPANSLTEMETWSGTGTTVRLGLLDADAVSEIDVSLLTTMAGEFRHLAVSVIRSA